MTKKIFIPLIIFLVFFGFLALNFRKMKIVEIKAATTNWDEDCGAATKSGCTCSSVTLTCSSSPSPSCSYSCPSRQNATVDNNCTYTVSGDCNDGSGCAIHGVPNVGFCQGGFSCLYQTGKCTYTCSADFENCDYDEVTGTDPTPGCECERPASCCDGNIRKYDCAICDGTSCNSDNACSALVSCLTQDCGEISSCSSGYCATCPGNCLNCDQDPNSASWDSGCNAGCEEDVSSDNNNCGGCNIACGPTENCINGLCVSTGTADVWGWAWSENIGWISFNCLNDYNNDGIRESHCTDAGYPSDYGVTVDSSNGKFSGYAWSENIGWIRFNPPPDYNTGVYPDCTSNGTCPVAPNHPAELDPSTKKVTGWVRACAGLDDDGDGVPNNCEGPTRTDGWDGWILLGPITYLSTDFGVNYVPTGSGEFHNWGWGSDNIGWISFWGSNITIPSPSGLYVVSTSLVLPNSPPYVESTALSGEKYCNINPGVGQVGFQWVYKDDDGDEQAQYHLQVSTVDFSDATFGPEDLVVDSINSQPGIASGGTGTSAVSVKQTPSPDPTDLDIGYNQTYYWRVRVKAATGSPLWSDWVQYDDPGDPDGDGNSKTFTTPLHAYPWVDFEPADGASLSFDSGDVQFCSIFESGVCETEPATGWTACYDADGNCNTWDWTFWGGTPGTSSDPNPLVTYSAAGDKQADLTVTDSDNYSCTVTHKFELISPLTLPKWEEIPPF